MLTLFYFWKTMFSGVGLEEGGGAMVTFNEELIN